MKKSLLIALSFVSVLSASQSATELFTKCASCHGDKGQKHSLDITKFIAGMPEKKVINILQEYREKKRNTYGLGTIMYGQTAKLSDEDIGTLAKHISSLPPVIVDIAKENNVTVEITGEQIFQVCSICHGKSGEKHSLKVSKQIAGMNKDSVVKILKEYQAGTRNKYGYGSMMRGQATKLSDDEMNKVATYVSGLTPVVKVKDSDKESNKKITKQEIDYNTFISDFFRKSTNPNETLKAAEAAYKEYKKNLKETNETNK